MYAKPNVLNKILPCKRLITLDYFTATAGSHSGGNLFGRAFDADSIEKVYMECVFPNWIKPSTTGVLKVRGMPTVANETGSDKVVRLYAQYTITGKTGVGGSTVSPDPVEITIPDNEPAKTIHVTDLLTLSVCCPQDIFCVTILRDATHANDTWANDWMMFCGMYLEILSDRIGEK